jgi:hypothetical protein
MKRLDGRLGASRESPVTSLLDERGAGIFRILKEENKKHPSYMQGDPKGFSVPEFSPECCTNGKSE